MMARQFASAVPGVTVQAVDATDHAAKNPCLREQLHALARQQLT
jgi:hypothetical protein